MTNILEAIYHIINQRKFELTSTTTGKNRINAVGYGLENYIKDAFAGTFAESDEQQRFKIFAEKFSWLGSQNNPPDLMIRGGDAIEVKKTQSSHGNLALNSSYPKNRLTHNHPMITRACRDCEVWTEKDLIYCIGQVTNNKLHSLWFVYGTLYAADSEVYQRIRAKIEEGISEIPDVIFSPTKELGRVNEVDPLGITNLRVRGMWEISNPRKVFHYLPLNSSGEFELTALIPEDKYLSFPISSREKLENLYCPELRIDCLSVQNPNNPANLIPIRLIRFNLLHIS